MIPTLQDIIRMLISGECSHQQALGWLADHERQGAEADAGDRRMFAAMALQGMVGDPSRGGHLADYVRDAVRAADLLMDALAQNGPEGGK